MDLRPPMSQSHLRAATPSEQQAESSNSNMNNGSNHSKSKRPPLTSDEKRAQAQIRSERIAQRRASARDKLKDAAKNYPPNRKDMELVQEEDLNVMYEQTVKEDPELKEEGHSWMRNLWGSSTSHYVEYPYQSSFMADDTEYYDEWAQAYRLLGAFVDCGHDKDGDSGDGGGGYYGNEGKCSRWSMWAAYVNPNYSGGGRAEYFSSSTNYYNNYGDDAATDDASSTVGSLDCHSSNTQWKLIGVYRQELYQWYEQISKHLWAIDDYEYVVALAGLAYMTDADCSGVGYDSDSQYLYTTVKPTTYGNIEMGLYSDSQCLFEADTDATYDDFSYYGDMDLGSKDDGSLSYYELEQLYEYWSSAQEYTMELFNEVYDEYKYCTLCMDYPTYQDGYFIGDSGTDDDDLINQCWKFHSHDSFQCKEDCVAMGSLQGSILQVDYNGKSYGTSWDGSTSSGASTNFDHKSKQYTSGNDKMQKLKSNAFLTFNGVLFISTFLAFTVARGSRKDGLSDKRKSLLSREERRKARSPGSRSRRGSKSKKRGSSSKNRSAEKLKSTSGRRRSSSRSRKADSSRSKSRSRNTSATAALKR